jgi:hypothetical protein
VNRTGFILIILTSLGCQNASNQLEKPHTTYQDIELGIQISVTEDLSVQKNDSIVLICKKPTYRNAVCLSMEKVGSLDHDSIANWEILNLDNGGQVYYRTEKFNEGSGGPEEHLTGYIVIKNQYFKITCADQAENGKPDSRWCVTYIKSIKKRE